MITPIRLLVGLRGRTGLLLLPRSTLLPGCLVEITMRRGLTASCIGSAILTGSQIGAGGHRPGSTPEDKKNDTIHL